MISVFDHPWLGALFGDKAAQHLWDPQTLAAGGGFSEDTAIGAAVAVALADIDTMTILSGDADAGSQFEVLADSQVTPSKMDLPLFGDGLDPISPPNKQTHAGEGKSMFFTRGNKRRIGKPLWTGQLSLNNQTY